MSTASYLACRHHERQEEEEANAGEVAERYHSQLASSSHRDHQSGHRRCA